jgi:hypothetical protein
MLTIEQQAHSILRNGNPCRPPPFPVEQKSNFFTTKKMDEKNICSEFLNEILTFCCIKTAKFKIDFFLSFSSSYKISTFLRRDGSSETVFLRRNVAEHVFPVKQSVCLNVVQIHRSETCSNKEWLNGNLHTKMPFVLFSKCQNGTTEH